MIGPPKTDQEKVGKTGREQEIERDRVRIILIITTVLQWPCLSKLPNQDMPSVVT